MGTEGNKEFIRRYLDAISGKPKPESVLRLFIAEQPLIEHIMVAEAAFPLYHLDAEEIVAESDLVSLRGRLRGKHLGPFAGLPASGRDFDVALFITYKVQDGKIVDHWMLTDNMTMMQQLGAIPTTA